MTKEQMVAKVAGEVGISKAKAAKALDTILGGITMSLKRGEKVTFVGFGTFLVSQRAARTGRNPRTGAVLQIPAARVPRFKAGSKLKAAVR
ncbi:HU family DNA-binding protein [Candidatus Zixiibacteriota bacterium]